MSTNEILRRRAALLGAGQSVDWESIAKDIIYRTITSIDLEACGITTVGQFAFRYCTRLTQVTFPSNFVKADNYSFQNIKVTHLYIPSGILSDDSFSGNGSLKSVRFGANVTRIWYNAFGGCSACEEMIFEGETPPQLNATTPLGSKNYTFPIYVPDSAVNTYKAASNWDGYASRIKGISERPAGVVVKRLYLNNLYRHYGERMAA